MMQMRDATKEEQEGIRKYIESISVRMIPITVLEDIKEEIRKMPNRNPSYSHTCDVVDREDVFDIIDSHISGKGI